MARHRVDDREARAIEGGGSVDEDSESDAAATDGGRGTSAVGHARPRLPVWWSMVLDGEESLIVKLGAAPYRFLLRIVS